MAASVLPNGAACAWPALLINISMRPKCAPACAKPACTDASTLTSSTQMATLPAWPASSSCRRARASRAPSRPARVTRAPASSKAPAQARPMPLPAPVTSACLLANALSSCSLFISSFQQPRSHLLRGEARVGGGQLALALQIAFQLLLARTVLFRPRCACAAVADARHFRQGPGRVGQVRTAHGAQVGAPGGDDAVGVVGFENGADGHAGG